MVTDVSEKGPYHLLVLYAGDRSVPTFVHARSPKQLLIYTCRGTPTYVNTDRPEKGQFVAHGDYSRIDNCRTNFAWYFERYLEILVVFLNIHVFIPPFPPNTWRICASMVGKHCCKWKCRIPPKRPYSLDFVTQETKVRIFVSMETNLGGMNRLSVSLELWGPPFDA